MRILFIGDSIVRGTVGVNWVAALAGKHPAWQVDNAGMNGETLACIRKRLDKKLRQSAYDIIVLEAGMNDIIIPALATKGRLFRKAARHLERKGYQPLQTPPDFEKSYRQTITRIRARSRAAIILTTLGCITEDLSHPLNRRRDVFNSIIRRTAMDNGCQLADTACGFDEYLKNQLTSTYFLENFFNTTWFDKWQSRLGKADRLSKKRKLHLTIDGVHLNSTGAKIFSETVEREIAGSMEKVNRKE